MAEQKPKRIVGLKSLRLPPFRRPYRPRPQSQITALDLDGLTLRVVQAVSQGSHTSIARVTSASLDLAADADRSDPAVMGLAIAKALLLLGLRPGSVVMGIPRAQVVLRTLSLPVIEDRRELASMVHFQIGRDLPFPMEEAVVDFKVRRQNGPPPPESEPARPALGPGEVASPAKREVLVAAVQREVVKFYERTAQAAGVKLAALGLLAYANARCAEACQVAEGEQAFALVSLRPDEVNIDVISQQTLLFSRGAIVKPPAEPAPGPAHPPIVSEPDAGLPVPSPDVPPLEPAAAPITPPAEPSQPTTFPDLVTLEVVRSLHSYSGMEPHNPTVKVVVTGASGQEAAVVEALRLRLSVPCGLLDPASAFELPPNSREHASGAIAAIGLALGVNDPQGLPFDFLNPKRPAVQRDLRRLRLLAGAATAAAAVVFVLLLRTHLVHQRLEINRGIATELSEAERKRPISRAMTQQGGTLSEWTKGSRAWLDHLAYLSAILPPSEEVYITSLSSAGGQGWDSALGAGAQRRSFGQTRQTASRGWLRREAPRHHSGGGPSRL